MAGEVRLPGPSNRTLVIGRTGSGKSVFAAWLLSMQNFDTMPWVIVDFKDEHTDIINQIDRSQRLTLYDPLPTKPGIYIVKPTVTEIEDGSLRDWFQRVFESGGGIGLFVDETFPIGQHNDAFDTILMQGRSKMMPVICCTQRPVKISTFAFSEASYIFVFDLTKIGDRRKIAEELPVPANYNLPEYHSYYFDVAKKNLVKLGPSPESNAILARIDERIPMVRRTI